MSNTVSKDDMKKAVAMIKYYLKCFAFDEETGKHDINKLNAGTTRSQKNNIDILKDIINSLERKHGKLIPIDDLVELAEDRDIDEDKVQTLIEKMRRAGELFEPRRGYLSKI